MEVLEQLKSPVGKGENWERFSVAQILNIQSKLSVNSGLKPLWNWFQNNTGFFNTQVLVYEEAWSEGIRKKWVTLQLLLNTVSPYQCNMSGWFLSNSAWVVSSLRGQPNGKGFSRIVSNIVRALGFESSLYLLFGYLCVSLLMSETLFPYHSNRNNNFLWKLKAVGFIKLSASQQK